MKEAKYIYQGIPLKHWCINNNKSYSTAIGFIKRNKDKYDNQEELIEECVKFLNNDRFLYYYNDELLSVYCKRNNLSYNTAVGFIQRNKDKYNTIEECIADCIKYLENLDEKIKYYYKGVSLSKYCTDNNISYGMIKLRIKDLKEKEPNLTNDELVRKSIEEFVDPRSGFTYKGMSLCSYCKKHGYNFQRIYIRIKHLTDQEEINKKIEEFINDNPKEKRVIYNINGMSLRKYCEENNMKYPTVKSYIQTFRKENKDLTDEEVVLKAINHYKENHKEKYRYFYKGIPLTTYCKEKNLDYTTVISCLFNMDNIDTYNITDEQMNHCIHRIEIKRNKELYFKAVNSNSDIELLSILEELNIDKKELIPLVEKNYTLKQAFIYYWYTNNNVILEANKELKLNELLGLYRSNIENTLDIIYDKCFLPIRKIKQELLKKYAHLLSKDFIEELDNIADYYFVEAMNRVTGRDEASIVAYINKYVRGNLLQHILKKIEDNKVISFDKNIYENSKSKSNKTLLDKIEAKCNESNFYSSLDDLDNFTDTEKIILTLYFEYMYTLIEISKYLKISLEEVKDIYNKCINRLKENNKVKLLIK